MPTPIRMPALSPTMSEGNLARWLKKEGDMVTAGDVIAEIETDKATMEVEAVDEGRLGRIVVNEGTENVPVNEVIALLLDEGEDASALDAGGADGGTPEASASVPTATPPSAPAEPEPAAPAAPAPPPGASGEAPLSNGSDRRISASPLAARMAAQAGIDLQAVQGTGPHGRIVKRDIERVLAEGVPAAAPAPAAPPEPAEPRPAPTVQMPPPAIAPSEPPPGGVDEIPLSMTRKVIARRLTEAKQTIPHFYVSTEIALDALLKLRAEINGRPDAVRKISVNDLVIKAAAVALRELPDVNVSFGGDRLYRYRAVDISVAVAIPDGLITPIVRDADRKGLATIAAEMADLAERARAGKLKPEEFQGGSFSISNLGMYGVSDFQAVINPPQGAILAVAAGEQRPVVKDGALAIATMMTATLSIDHRAIDGALAAEWLKVFKGLVESPLSMLI